MPRKTGWTDLANFRRVFLEDFEVLQDIVQAEIFLRENDILDGSKIGERARKIVGKNSKILQLLRYYSHVCYVSSIMLYSIPIVVHRVINSSEQLST